jgi:hypothetical protein
MVRLHTRKPYLDDGVYAQVYDLDDYVLWRWCGRECRLLDFVEPLLVREILVGSTPNYDTLKHNINLIKVIPSPEAFRRSETCSTDVPAWMEWRGCGSRL